MASAPLAVVMFACVYPVPGLASGANDCPGACCKVFLVPVPVYNGSSFTLYDVLAVRVLVIISVM